MTWMKEYVLSITAAGILCAIIKQLISEKSANGKIVRIVAGVFLVITMLNPLLRVKLRDFSFYYEDYIDVAEFLSEDGANIANKEMKAIISEKSEAYIFKEASHLGLDIQAQVLVSNQTPPVPIQVELCGEASPYKKERLILCISDNLNVSRERIIWN